MQLTDHITNIMQICTKELLFDVCEFWLLHAKQMQKYTFTLISCGSSTIIFVLNLYSLCLMLETRFDDGYHVILNVFKNWFFYIMSLSKYNNIILIIIYIHDTCIHRHTLLSEMHCKCVEQNVGPMGAAILVISGG